MNRNEFRFFSSQRVPSFSPGLRTETWHRSGTTFLHVAIADADPDDEAMQRARVRHRLLSPAQIGLGDDFEERRAGAVQVNTTHAAKHVVQRLAGVFLEVRA